MKRVLCSLVIVLAFLPLGCQKKTPMTAAGGVPVAGKTVTAAQMRSAIIKGCIERQWKPVEISPGLIEASITVRGKHHVTVSIPYSADHYDIKYKSSSNMGEQQKNGEIKLHRNYNTWVNNLHQAIQRQLAMLNM
ncbi:MAG: hypothetical protein K6F46_10395 [Desulfovibrio sp.]|nr:hypothetical protein [Desulfovibrio sp.]